MNAQGSANLELAVRPAQGIERAALLQRGIERAAAFGASSGSRDVTACPMAGPFTLTNTIPSRLATYSSRVVLP
jgi:hypothetical protein